MLDSINYFLLNHTPFLYLTQSLWRDEAFSVFISKHSISEIIKLTGGDFNPPLYYILLHFWIKIFGAGVETLRIFSFIAFLLLVFVVYKFSKTLFSSKTTHNLIIFTTLTNPMLLYFAFELRMYSLFALFATLSMYFLYNKKWTGYILSSTAGLYTQPFMVFVLIAQGAYMILIKQAQKLIKPWVVVAFLFIPWTPTLFAQFSQSGHMWIWPVDIKMFLSVVGNLFVGYEGTPPHLWNTMIVLSFIFITLTLLTRVKKNYKKNLLFILWIYLPLALVLGISIVKPIYVHRYVIFVTVGEIFILASFYDQFKKNLILRRFMYVFILFFALTNFYAAPFHKKTDFKTTFEEISLLIQDGDEIYANTPLNYYESLYYAPNPENVYLYNPENIVPPRFVGGIGIQHQKWRKRFPSFPKRAFLIYNNGEFEAISVL